MEFCLNVPLSGEHQPEQVLSSKHAALSTTSLDDLFSTHNTEADVALEWLSVFVEDCLSSKGNCLPPPSTNDQTTKTTASKQPSHNLLHGPKDKLSCMNKFGITGKARSKRKRIAATKTKNNPLSTAWSQPQQHSSFLHTPVTDPPLLHQTQWLADSELIEPKKYNNNSSSSSGSLNSINSTFSCVQKVKEERDENEEEEEQEEEEEEKGILGIEKERDISGGGGQQQPRRCTHCLSQRTPQWRAGPLGPKTLCNACGVRYKSGRLLPEYRPAKSPTFVSYLHSNSHKKVLEMRMQGQGVHNLMSSIPSPK